MNWFFNLKIRNKIIISNAFFIGMIFVLAVQGYFAVARSNRLFDDFISNQFVPMRQMGQITQNLLQIRINQLQEMQHAQEGEWDVVRERLAASAELRKQNADLWKEYLAANTSREEKKLAEESHSLFLKNEEDAVRFRQAIEARDMGRAEKAEDAWLVSYKPLEKSIAKLAEIQKVAAEEMDKENEALSVRSTILSISVLLGALVLGLGVSWVLNRGVAVPITAAVTRIRDIAEGEGDLTKRLEATSTDEVGDLAQWLNRFIEKIHDIVKEIALTTDKVLIAARKTTESSQSLSAGTQEMSVQSTSIASAATQMSQNIQVISSSVEEMSTSVAEVARKTSEAASVAGEADRTALGASHTISELGDSATEIGKVIETIVNIANQTNLLALNASIEAAGAGEAGRGFAVVASEVKELARQSAAASEDIKSRIHAIQGNTRKAVDAIGSITEVIAQVNNISSAIASAVEEQSITSREIARNVEQSAQAAGEVTRNIAGVSTAANDGAKDAQSVAGLAHDLNTLSDRLSAIVKQFKI